MPDFTSAAKQERFQDNSQKAQFHWFMVNSELVQARQ